MNRSFTSGLANPASPALSPGKDRSPNTRRRKYVCALILLAALIPSAWLAWTFRDMPHLGVFYDDTIYLVSAKSLAEGTGYRIVSLPDQPYQTKYPPLYPLMLSAVWRLAPSFPANLPWATLAAWLVLPAYLFIAGILFRDLGLGKAHALALCVILALNGYVILFSITLLSDLTFCCLLLGSLVLAERAQWAPSGTLLAFGAAILAGAAYLTRTAALPLLVSVPCCFLFRNQRSRAVVFFVTMLPFVAVWNLWVRLHLSTYDDPLLLFYTHYFDYYLYNVSWQTLPGFFWRNLTAVPSAVGGMLAPYLDRILSEVYASTILTLVSAAGIGRLLRAGKTGQYSTFGMMYFLMLLFWHYPPNARFAFPLLPLLLAGLSVLLREGLLRLHGGFRSSHLKKSLSAALMLSVITILLSFTVFGHAAMFHTMAIDRSNSRKLSAREQQVYEWIRWHLPADAAFITYHDARLYLFAGRRAVAIHVPPRLFSKPVGVETLFSSLAEFARRHRLEYMLVSSRDFDRGEPVPRERLEALISRVAANEAQFRLLYHSSAASVYRVRVWNNHQSASGSATAE
jgi:hypothetical protein